MKTVIVGSRVQGSDRYVKILIDDSIEVETKLPDRVKSAQDIESHLAVFANKQRIDSFTQVMEQLKSKNLQSGQDLSEENGNQKSDS